MALKKKVIIDRIELETIIPSMFMEILRDYIAGYARSNNFRSYKVNLGYIEKTRMVEIVESVPLLPRNALMTREATIIEANLFKHYKIDDCVYAKVQTREILNYRYKIQYFMAYYSGMSFKNIGAVTGGKDHSTITHIIGETNRKIKKNPEFNKEMFMLDMNIFYNLGMTESKVFDFSGNIKRKMFKKKLHQVVI